MTMWSLCSETLTQEVSDSEKFSTVTGSHGLGESNKRVIH